MRCIIMLTELSIKDFAIIDKIAITFNDGLTVLTGETGAGKSIIIDAIQLLAGGRGSVEFVRYGAKKAEIGRASCRERVQISAEAEKRKDKNEVQLNRIRCTA